MNASPAANAPAPASHAKLLDALRDALGTVVQGKRDALELVLVAMLANGHVLLEDVPGVGKTTLAKALARAFSLPAARVQFTPDLLPADILGTQVLNPRDGSLSFQSGPVFTNVLLADEVNRASPRTQAALLEAMNEAQVTLDGVTRPLPKPFLVLATQNPVDFAGTYPLPEAQLDRFLLRLSLGYPAPEAELAMLYARQKRDPLEDLAPVATGEDLLELQRAAQAVEVREPVGRYLVRLVGSTRAHKDIALGASPRGALALFRAAQARALLQGRKYVSPDDLQSLAVPVLAHRLTLAPQARYGGASAAALLTELCATVPVPV